VNGGGQPLELRAVDVLAGAARIRVAATISLQVALAGETRPSSVRGQDESVIDLRVRNGAFGADLRRS
jgi:hypothetical protein